MSNEPVAVLHVEDNRDHANLIARGLRKHNANVEIHLAEDGEAALDYLFRRGDYGGAGCVPQPQLVLLDLRLPKLDGLEVLRAIKGDERLLPIPVVVLTSSDAESDVAKAYEYHANSYLVKPVDFSTLTEMMRQLGTYWLSWNRYPRASNNRCE